MERYDSYKDSGVDWIGEVPSHWMVTKHKYHLQLQNGYPFKSELFDTEKGFPLIRIRDITSGKIETFYRGDFEEEYVVKEGDLLIGMDGDFNTRTWDGVNGLLNQRCCSVKEGRKMSRRFLHYILPNELQIINDLTYYTTVKHLSIYDVYDTDTIQPPLHEQEQIVEYLDRKTTLIDSLIEKTVRKIELLKEKRTSLINEVVTKGLNPDVEMKDSGVEWIGEIPSHWELSKIKFECEIFGRIGFRGYTTEDIVDEGEGVITISPSNIFNDEFNLKNRTFLSWEKYHESPEIQIFHSDIILVKTGSTIGKTAIIPEGVPEMTINPQLVVLKRIRPLNRYLFAQTTCRFIKESFDIEQTGSTTPTISQEKIKEFPLLLPPLHEQEQIVEYLDEQTSIIDSTITTEEKRIELLKEYRLSLISEVVTGKIKVTRHE